MMTSWMKRVEMRRVKTSPTSTVRTTHRLPQADSPQAALVPQGLPAAIAVPADAVGVADVARVRAAVAETPAAVVLRRRKLDWIDGIRVALRRGPFLLPVGLLSGSL